MPQRPLVDRSTIEEVPPARYVVGIDLGTTNSAVSYVDTWQTPWHITTFWIPQVTAPGTIESCETLPSFHYEGTAQEISAGTLRLPWTRDNPRFVVGSWARDAGGLTAGRLITSAKSWLCHSGIDRTAEILPWHAAADVERISPVEASARYLRHIHDAWNYCHPDAPLSQQDIILTLPASFDEVARQLTVEAARRAGLSRVVLIEEPQAAFYAWIYRHREDWHHHVTAGQTVLVCDIGGGTTDFTLIRIRREQAENVPQPWQFHRVAVGEHLLLGGDNLDLYLAHYIEDRFLPGEQLPPRQWEILVRQCRRAKEMLLSDEAPDSWTIRIPSAGMRLIGNAVECTVGREEVQQLLLDGFLPHTRFDETPATRRSGFQEFGLPYAPDPAIPRYLSQFLRIHARAGREEGGPQDDLAAARPDLVLFNGGFFNSRLLQQRLLDILRRWFADLDAAWQPLVLAHDKLHLAVANGAAYYGMVRRGEGVRISANLARSYYVGVQADRPMAVCLIPGHAQPGSTTSLHQTPLQMTVSQPVEFPLYVSSTRLVDQPGQLVEIQHESLRALPAIRTVLQSQRKGEADAVPVILHAQLTEIGTIELWCSQVGAPRRWRLEFDVRAATRTDLEPFQPCGPVQVTFSEELWSGCAAVLADVFHPQGKGKPEELMTCLSKRINLPRDQWPSPLLRRIWYELWQWEAGRRKSPVHEARWLNLLGFALRPGYGVAVDDWRVSQTWRTVYGRLAFEGASRNEALILWRRIAGGLSAGQQRALLEPLLPQLRLRTRHPHKSTRRTPTTLDPAQLWYTVGSLEWIDVHVKRQLGEEIAQRLQSAPASPLVPAWVWALGRLAQRVPSYGPLNTVVDAEYAESWLEILMGLANPTRTVQFAVMLAARRTHDRYRDIAEAVRHRVLAWLEHYGAAEHLRKLVQEGGQLEAEEQAQAFGESLPLGLRLPSAN